MSAAQVVNKSEEAMINTLIGSSAEREKTIAKVLDDLDSIKRECKMVRLGLRKAVRKGK